MSKKSIYDKNLKVLRSDAYLGTFSFLFSEICQRFLASNKDCNLDQELIALGEKIGAKFLDLIILREKNYKREIKHIEMLKFVQSTVWKHIFGKPADSLEKIKDSDTGFKIVDSNLNFIQFASPHPIFHVGSFAAGIIQGLLKVANFPCEIQVSDGNSEGEIFFFIELSRDVITREAKI